MWSRSLLTVWKSVCSSSRGQHSRPARRRRRPISEQLEERRLPANYAAATVSALIMDTNLSNTAGGANTITLTAPTTSPYVLTAINNGSNGLPVIAANDNLTIVGNGDTIERKVSGRPTYFRLLDVASGGSLTLENLTLQGGQVVSDSGQLGGPGVIPTGAAEGGAVYNQGTLVLNGVTVQDNSAGQFHNPSGDGGQGAAGGGIFSLDGSVTLEGGTIIRNNEAEGSVTELCCGYLPAGDAWGGGLAALGGSVTVTNATLEDNTALAGLPVEPPGAAGNAYGGGLYAGFSTVNLSNATLDDNAATGSTGNSSGGDAYGGGAFLIGGTATLTSGTVQGNSSVGQAGEGGGIYIFYGSYPVGLYPEGPFAYAYTYVYLDAITVAQVTGNTASSGAAYDNIVGPYTLT